MLSYNFDENVYLDLRVFWWYQGLLSIGSDIFLCCVYPLFLWLKNSRTTLDNNGDDRRIFLFKIVVFILWWPVLVIVCQWSEDNSQEFYPSTT